MKDRPSVHSNSVETLGEIRVHIRSDADIILARGRGREIAAEAGFQTTDLTLIATAISELARNIVQYAREGEIILELVRNSSRPGIMVTARDEGPGILSTERAMEVGFSTSGGLGLGLPGVKRLMDELNIESKPGEGTVVKATKWKR